MYNFCELSSEINVVKLYFIDAFISVSVKTAITLKTVKYIKIYEYF